jgi:serpin B
MTVTEFGLRLFQELIASEAGNIIISPLSLWMVLAMTASGARNQTLTQFLKVLKVQDTQELKQISTELVQKLMVNDSDLQVNIANAFGCPNAEAIKDFFLEDVKKIYHGQIFQGAEFRSKTINAWVSKHTNNKIQNLLDESKALDAAALINAVYFNGKWKHPFKSHMTQRAPFFTKLTSSQPCQMMTNTGYFRYYETEEYQSILLPYESSDYDEGARLSALILLPKSHDLHKVAVLGQTPDSFNNLIAHLSQASSHSRVELFVPKFKLDFSALYNQPLYRLGLHDAFLAKEANFSGIMDGPMYIETVLQKVFIAVDENGTEAAAASAVLMTRGLPMHEPAIEMRCDRPFLFAVMDETRQNLLFLASIKNVQTE